VLEVADVFRAHGAASRKAHGGRVSLPQFKVMSAIERCRTSALGGHVERCEDCAATRIPTIPAAPGIARSAGCRGAAMARRPRSGACAGILLSRRLHPSGGNRRHCVPEQRPHLWSDPEFTAKVAEIVKRRVVDFALTRQGRFLHHPPAFWAPKSQADFLVAGHLSHWHTPVLRCSRILRGSDVVDHRGQARQQQCQTEKRASGARRRHEPNSA
jgi:hypothetical protein